MCSGTKKLVGYFDPAITLKTCNLLFDGFAFAGACGGSVLPGSEELRQPHLWTGNLGYTHSPLSRNLTVWSECESELPAPPMLALHPTDASLENSIAQFDPCAKRLSAHR
jgi:hypothetical protein